MQAMFAAKALAKAREEIAALGDPSAGLMIFRGIPDTDVKRGPHGEVVWSKRPTVAWRAWCIPLAEWPVEMLDSAEIDGVPVVVLRTQAPDTLQTFRICVKRGKLHAAVDA